MKQYLLFLIILFLSSPLFAQEEGWYLITPEHPIGNGYGAVCPISEDLVYVILDQGYIYKSNDGGDNWSEFNSGITEVFVDFKFFNSNFGIAVGSNGTIVKTSDAGVSWTQINSGSTNNLTSIGFASLNNIWITGEEGTVLHSTDNGNTWVSIDLLTNEKLNAVSFKNEIQGYIAGNNGTFLYTANGGDSWNPLDLETNDDLYKVLITDNYIQIPAGYIEDNYYYTILDRVYKTIDNLTWSTYTLPDQSGLPISDVAFPTDMEGFTMGSDMALCDCCSAAIDKTTDGGLSWLISLSLQSGSNPCVAIPGYANIQFLNEEIGYALLGDNLFKTTDGGTSTTIASVEDFRKDNNITLYPNPTNGEEITLQIKNTNTENMSLQLLDPTGKNVYSLDNVVPFTKVETSQLENGLYFVLIKSKGHIVAVKKLVKK